MGDESRKIVFFTHIPKTAGTSARKSIFSSRIPGEDRHRPNGYWSAITSKRSFSIVEGHSVSFGIHHFYNTKNPQYFVVLRDPLDRAISFYYFIKDCSGASYRHPLLDDVRECSLREFYERPEYQNVQARSVAGLLPEYAGRYISLNGVLGKFVLEKAKRNLTEYYEAFGLTERFKDTVELFARRLDVEPEWPEKRHKATGDRPDVSDLSEDVKQSLRASNSLDLELYKFARSQFERQTESE